MKPGDQRASAELSEEQIANYLKNHPGFFLKHDNLLMELELAHPSGDAVSLLERQVALLRERNMDMRQRLGNLLENARRNDRLFEQTKQVVLGLLESRSLDQLTDTLHQSLHEEFKLEFAALTLFGEPERHRGVHARVVPLGEARRDIDAILKSSKAVCGILRREELEFLFGAERAGAVGSAAVMPLSYPYPLGVLAIGSRDPQHFRSSMGTLFLGYIAEVLNRLLPHYLQPG